MVSYTVAYLKACKNRL